MGVSPATSAGADRRTCPAACAPGRCREHSLHFARVTPVVGQSLWRARVALVGLPAATPLVTHLAACGVGRWSWLDPGDGSDAGLRAYLLAQHGPSLGLDAISLPTDDWLDALRCDPPDLVVAVGAGAQPALEAAASARIPSLFIRPATNASACQAISIFPEEDMPVVRVCSDGLNPPTPTRLKPRLQTGVDFFSTPYTWDWITAAPLVAGLARAMLLRPTPHRRADLEELWAAGKRALTLGSGDEPLSVGWSEPGADCGEASARFRTPLARRGVLLIVGLGSLGSVAATYLAPYTTGMVVVDPDRVDAYNPVRQAYPLATIGHPKAQSLRDGLLKRGVGEVVALETALTDEGKVVDLLKRHPIAAALVVTGTSADYTVARALRACDVPHLVGRCYPRARYWEAILVDGQRGPSLGDLRGHLFLGPSPPPTPEQIAAYSDAGALEAEPATLIESGWAAAWMARLSAQLLAPPGLRERWFLELLASERTCLIGGVGVELSPDGPAYHVTQPGQICAWKRRQIKL